MRRIIKILSAATAVWVMVSGVSMAQTDWSGFYVGAQAGYGRGEVTSTFILPDPDGALAGIFAGYNAQPQPNFVVGIEADFTYSWMDGTDPCGNPSWTCETEVGWTSMVRGRAGYAVNNFLLYGSAGVAFAKLEGSTDDNLGAVYPDDDVVRGWTVGAGVEVEFVPNIAGRLDYRYAAFGKTDLQFDIPYLDTELKMHALMAGVSYMF
jgi:outer membrane immunogenic protein